MNIPYLVKTLKTDKLSEVVANIDLPSLDMNLAIWDSIDAGEIKIDEDNNHIAILKEPEPSSDLELKHKILRVIQHYAREGTNITRGRLNSYIKDPVTGQGYPWHEYILAVQHLIDGELVSENVIDVPEQVKTFTNNKGKKKQKVVRPAHKFAFLGLTQNAAFNAEWDAKTVNKWIEDMEKQLTK